MYTYIKMFTAAQPLNKGDGDMSKKYIHYIEKRVYAIYYRENNTIYYNLDFTEGAQLILLY